MFPFKLGFSFEAVRGSRHASHADLDEGVNLADIQEACDWLRAQLDDASLSRTELMTLAAGLEPLGRRLQHVLKYSRARHGHVRATRLLEESLHQIYDCLYSVQPFRPYIWPAVLRARLGRTLQSIGNALIALRWADAQAKAS